jgi:hypothetical protein
MADKPKPYSREKSVRRVARERVGTVPGTRVIVPKKQRKRPKHKKRPDDQDEA